MVFEEAAVHWDLASGQPMQPFTGNGDPRTPEVPSHDGYFGEIDYVLGCIEPDEDPKTSAPADSRTAVSIALLEEESAARGEAISLD